MMTSSEVLALADICEAIVDCEHKTAPTQASGIPLIRTPDIQNGKLNLNSAKKVSEGIYQEWSRRMEPKAEDIVLAREAPVGEVGYVPKGERVCLGQRTVLIRINNKVAYPRYILYLLCAAPMRDKMASLAAGSVVPHLNMEDIRVLPLSELPSFEEQKAIGDILGALDDKIELDQQMNKTLEGIGQAVFKRWFVDFEFPNEEGKPYKSSGGELVTSELGMIPKNWAVKRLEEITEVIFSGGTPDTSNNEYWNGSYPWLSSGETSSHFIFKTEKKITKEGIDNSSTRLAKKGDIVIASAGQGKTRGQTSLCLIDSFINQSIIALRTRNKIVPNSHLFFNLSLRYPQLRAISDSHSIRGSLTTRLFKELEIVLPPLESTSAFNEWFIPAIKKIYSNLVGNEALSENRDALLPKLMSGKIRVPVQKEKVKAS